MKYRNIYLITPCEVTNRMNCDILYYRAVARTLEQSIIRKIHHTLTISELISFYNVMCKSFRKL